MAEVFRATLASAEGFERPVAIKRVLPGLSADPLFAQMFRTEAQIASLLMHPNIVSVLDFDRDEQGRLFLVMELVEGRDLRKLLSAGRLPAPVTAFVVAQLLQALSFAHNLDREGERLCVVHRDISPHNILISWDGAVKLSDFGIAKAGSADGITSTGAVKGKVAYLSPEQARCEDLDGRSDLFAVGIVLHELLTGARLFSAQAQDAVIIHRVLQMPIRRPRAMNPEISERLEDVCMGLLERDRRKRIQGAPAALEALLRCPELTNRGQIDLARLMAERFPGAAPSNTWSAFGAPTRSLTSATQIRAQGTKPEGARKQQAAPDVPPKSELASSRLPFGGFTILDDDGALAKEAAAPSDVAEKAIDATRAERVLPTTPVLFADTAKIDVLASRTDTGSSRSAWIVAAFLAAAGAFLYQQQRETQLRSQSSVADRGGPAEITRAALPNPLLPAESSSTARMVRTDILAPDATAKESAPVRVEQPKPERARKSANAKINEDDWIEPNL